MNPLRALLATEVRLYQSGGRWFVTYRDPSGKRRFMRLSATTEAEAKTQHRKVQRAIDKDDSLRNPTKRPAARVPTLSEWWDQWRERRGNEVGVRTMQGYRSHWTMFVKHFGADTPLNAIDEEAAGEWSRGLSKGRQQISARSILGRCKALFADAVERGIIAESPLRRERSAMPIVDREWVYTSRADAAKLIAAAPSPAVGLWLALCRWGGLRPGEARRLLWSDYDPAKRRITVRGRTSTRTTKDRKRVVPVCPELAQILETRGEGRMVVGSKAGLEDGIRAAFRESRITADPRTPLHSLRRSRATDLLAEGHDVATVARIQGDSPIIVMRHYHQLTAEAEARITGCCAGVAPGGSSGRAGKARNTRFPVQETHKAGGRI